MNTLYHGSTECWRKFLSFETGPSSETCDSQWGSCAPVCSRRWGSGLSSGRRAALKNCIVPGPGAHAAARAFGPCCGSGFGPLQIDSGPACGAVRMEDCKMGTRNIFREWWGNNRVWIFLYSEDRACERHAGLKPRPSVKKFLKLWTVMRTVCFRRGLQLLWELHLQPKQAA